jgi:hypothetical protein
LDDNKEVESPAALAQGSILQVCVKIDGDVVTENILVEDILTFVVSQPNGTATDSETITNAVPDPLTDKVCRESGVCNVKTQLLSKFFTDTNLADLRVDGVAILAFGRAELAWGLRNGDEHGADPETPHMISLAKAELAIRRLYRAGDSLPTYDRFPFSDPMEDVLTRTVSSQERWITKTEAFLPKALRRIKTQEKKKNHSIKKLFGVDITPRIIGGR